jgi:hypothetical protein
MFAADGLDYPELVEILVRNALSARSAPVLAS